jgi:hypothetical protein
MSVTVDAFFSSIRDRLRRLWWLQGVIAALALITAINNTLDLSQTQYLALIHKVALDWNEWMGKAGAFLGKLPFIPTFSPEQTNLLSLFSVAWLPMIIDAFFSQHQYIGRLRSNPDWGILLDTLLAACMTIIATIIFFIAFVWQGTLDTGMFLVALGTFTVYCFMRNRGLGKAVFFVVTFLGVLEGIYLTDAFGSHWIDSFVCSGERRPPTCQSEAQ